MAPDKSIPPFFSPLDRHFGLLLERLSGGNNPALFLAAALASQGSRAGHVCLDLAAFAGKALLPEIPEEGAESSGRVSGESIPFCPTLSNWEEALRKSTPVGEPGQYKPLILDGKSRLYLYRYWFYEDALIRFVRHSVESPGGALPLPEEALPGESRQRLKEVLQRIFPEDEKHASSPHWQRIAALATLRRPFTVISGSPGTGKTTTAARIIALLRMLNRGRNLRIALTAPTGKAAIRLEEAIRKADAGLNLEGQPLRAQTLHRLLGAVPGSPSFRYQRGNTLPYELVIVDEASMVDLPLMAKLVMALSPASRLILLGDRDQLASVEAGAVLGDLCGPADLTDFFTPLFLADLRNLAGESFSLSIPCQPLPAVADSIVSLHDNYRFGASSGIGQLSRAVNEGNAESALSLLNSSRFADLEWRLLPEAPSLPAALKKELLTYFDAYLREAGRKGDPDLSFAIYDRFRILCALRQGPFGTQGINALLETLLRQQGRIPAEGKWYPGRPVMITRNDYGLGLFNGDVGLALPEGKGGGFSVFFRDPEKGFRRFAPFRLPPHETVYAMTVHKSQGSEFDEVLLILSDRDTPLMTRELIYTGVTRAKKRLSLWGREDLLRLALVRRITRNSGLRDGLWGMG